MSININQASLVSQDGSSLSGFADKKTARVEQQAAPTVQIRSDVVTLSATGLGADVSQQGKPVSQGNHVAAQETQNGNPLPPKVNQSARASVEQDTPEVAEQKEQVTAAVERLNSFVQDMKRELNFSYDEDLGVVVVKVVESSTDEIIRQIPSEEAVKMAQSLQDLREGGLFEAKA